MIPEVGGAYRYLDGDKSYKFHIRGEVDGQLVCRKYVANNWEYFIMPYGTFLILKNIVKVKR